MEENEIANKPKEGTYNEMTPSGDRKPKITFELDVPEEVTFSPDFVKPRELPSQDRGVFYIFECLHEGEEKVFLTAAWSMLQGLKDVEPLAGKTVIITKNMKEGKQHYDVEDLTNPEVPVERPGDEEPSDEDTEKVKKKGEE
ncbi:hypothetical protein LCGC14_0996560 [marine sediment metagenome]|uniref:Uncharacterized protein n=1 Tax=marine sediment metagenome TaxID=412755 RepID=A0A0F9QMS2_9ZZZZ